MPIFSPDGAGLLTSNLAAKLPECIHDEAATHSSGINKAATLDLAGGRDLSPREAETGSNLPDGRMSGAL